jgi:hypothetical protein
MSRDFEYVVREAVRDLADEGRAVNLADAAIRQGRRIVVRRQVLSVVAAIAVVAALAVPFALSRSRDQEDPVGAAPGISATDDDTSPTATPAAPAPIAQPTERVSFGPGAVAAQVGDGWVVAATPTGTAASLAYDRQSQSYVTVPYARVDPAPSGEYVAVLDKDRVGLFNLDSGTVRWVNGPANSVGTVDWTDDGQHLVYATGGKTKADIRLVTVDVRSAVGKILPGTVTCATECIPSWMPGERQIAVGSVSSGTVLAYNATNGEPAGKLPLRGAIPALRSWSPDGSKVIVRNDDAAAEIVDGKTGQPLAKLPDPAGLVYWDTDSTLLILRGAGVAVYDVSGQLQTVIPAPVFSSKVAPTAYTLARL